MASALGACVQETDQPNPEFCANARGDETCAERFPDGSRPYCVISECLDDHFGCFPDPPGDNCASPCGLADPDCSRGTGSGGSTASSSSGTADGTMTATEGGTGTGPLPCAGDLDCTDDAAPLCDVGLGQCVACDSVPDGDAACAGLDAGIPVCVDGQCRQCTSRASAECGGTTPICDDEANVCVACTSHAQCAPAGCNLFTGACLPPDAVVHVGPGQGLATLGEAVGGFMAGEEGTIVVHGNAAFDEAVVIGGGRVLALLANAGDAPRWVLTGGGGPQLEVLDATVLMAGIQVSGNADGVGVVADGSRVWVDRGRVVDNAGGGLTATAGSELVLRNCFVTRNGDPFADTRGISVAGSSLALVYDTIAANEGTGASGPVSLACDAGSDGQVRNSIVAAGSGTIDCPGVGFDHDVVDTGGLVGSNTVVLPFDPAWFPDIGMLDFHIDAGPPFEDVAQWQTGDPTTDFDGDARPNLDGSADYAGADLP
ncbi:MAG: right-handed parallel beta-helix repeat-containing protein [Nannocystaceae bacterium]